MPTKARSSLCRIALLLTKRCENAFSFMLDATLSICRMPLLLKNGNGITCSYTKHACKLFFNFKTETFIFTYELWPWPKSFFYMLDTTLFQRCLREHTLLYAGWHFCFKQVARMPFFYMPDAILSICRMPFCLYAGCHFFLRMAMTMHFPTRNAFSQLFFEISKQKAFTCL